MTQILKPSAKTYKLCKNLINNGELVAFPTETVYGLGADARNEEAVKKIYIAKGRPQDNPLIVHLSSKKDIIKYVQEITPVQKKLIKSFMPGPISIIFNRTNIISDIVCAGGPTVAIRIPENKAARHFIRATGCPICAPSANTSKRPSPTNANRVLEDMNGKIPLIVDGGETTIGIESTVVKVENEEIYILRPGKISKQMIENKTKCIVHENLNISNVIESPGTKYTHYKPKCEMIIVKSSPIPTINKLYEENILIGKKVVILCKKSSAKFFKDKNYIILGKDSTEASINIFEYLREQENNDLIIAEYFDNGNMVEALFNRMIKSASGNII